MGEADVLHFIRKFIARIGWLVIATPQLFTPRADTVHILQEAGLTSKPVWTYVENLIPPGFDCWAIKPLASHSTGYITLTT